MIHRIVQSGILALAVAGAMPSYAYSPNGDSTAFHRYELNMQQLAQRILRDTSKTARLSAHTELQTVLEEALKQENSFIHPFQVEGISIQTAPDQSFRLFSWQLYEDKNTYTYGGYLQMKDGTVHKLLDKSVDYDQPQFDRLSPKTWYGCLYYNIHPFKGPEGKEMYLLFGYDMYSFFNRRKVLDVLYFENGKPRFGAPVLEVKDAFGRSRMVHRMVLEYSSTVAVGLKYADQKGMVVYDHLVTGTPFPEAGPTNIPDGSYVGMKLEQGIWKYVEEVFTENPYYGNDNPPLPEPKFDEKHQKKDIFGRTKRN